jgi:hypothetical protein
VGAGGGGGGGYDKPGLLSAGGAGGRELVVEEVEVYVRSIRVTALGLLRAGGGGRGGVITKAAFFG